MADAREGVGDPQAPTPHHQAGGGGGVKPSSFVHHDHHHDHEANLRSSGKRDRDGEYGDGDPTILLHDEQVVQGDEHDGSKKAKLDSMGLDDDSLLDDLKSTQLVVGGVGVDGMALTGLGVGMQYFASTGNIKSPIFEGIPSLTPEWLLKKVWLKVNGDIEQTVLASLISKDMGPKLRQEIRSFLEKRGEIQTGNRINLKNTIMQAVEVTITCQKEKPTLTIIRDTNKQRPKKEGKQEKNFNIALTPYGQSVCIAELQLKKRDSFTQRSPSKMGSLNLGMSLGMSLGDSTQGLSPLGQVNISIPTTSPSPTLTHSPLAQSSHALAMNLGLWKPNVKDMNDELLKRNVQMGDLSGQLMAVKDEMMLMKEECHKKDMMIVELKNIIMDLKPSYPFPPHLLNPPITPTHLPASLNPNLNPSLNAALSPPLNPTLAPSLANDGVGVGMMDHTHHHTHSHPHAPSHSHSLSHSHSHSLSHSHSPHVQSQPHAHLQMHPSSDTAMLHIVEHSNLINETMMSQTVSDPQNYMPQ